jgi:hypothetical protein
LRNEVGAAVAVRKLGSDFNRASLIDRTVPFVLLAYSDLDGTARAPNRTECR